MSPEAVRSSSRWFPRSDETREVPAAASGWLDDLDDPAREAAPVVPEARGLSGALPGITAGAGLPFRDASFDARVSVVGAHGGAGEDTIAALDPGLLAAAGHAWPRTPGVLVPVIVTARSSYKGLTALQDAGRQHAAGTLTGLMVLGAVVIDDAPRVPKQLEQFSTLAGGLFPRLWRLPFAEELRLTGELGPAAPKAFTRFVHDIRALFPQAHTTS